MLTGGILITKRQTRLRKRCKYSILSLPINMGGRVQGTQWLYYILFRIFFKEGYCKKLLWITPIRRWTLYCRTVDYFPFPKCHFHQNFNEEEEFAELIYGSNILQTVIAKSLILGTSVQMIICLLIGTTKRSLETHYAKQKFNVRSWFIHRS